jgi:hypothetical protein
LEIWALESSEMTELYLIAMQKELDKVIASDLKQFVVELSSLFNFF